MVWDAVNDQAQLEQAPNPQCTESVCTEDFWVPARKLCLYCGFRGQMSTDKIVN